MKPFKLQITFGLILLIIGILFDFLFIERKISDLFKSDPIMYLNSFEKQLYDLTKFYMIILGILNMILSVITYLFPSLSKLDWMVSVLTVVGSILLISTGFWYAIAGPSFKWELRCTVLTIGLFAIAAGLCLEIYSIFTCKKIS